MDGSYERTELADEKRNGIPSDISNERFFLLLLAGAYLHRLFSFHVFLNAACLLLINRSNDGSSFLFLCNPHRQPVHAWTLKPRIHQPTSHPPKIIRAYRVNPSSHSIRPFPSIARPLYLFSTSIRLLCSALLHFVLLRIALLLSIRASLSM
ncbi:hypothetical protein DL98DRAFT_98030 [Cadophora sp. DSE1049]|nr:hypothetical protein DL98DRAFT_98030 [Cadophora sp. DSE1049]